MPEFDDFTNAIIEGDVEEVRRLYLSEYITLTGANKYTSLHWASIYGNDDIVRFLLDKGWDINSKTICRDTSLHCAAYHGHVTVVKTLIDRGCLLNSVDKNGFTALDLAKQRQHHECENILKEAMGLSPTSDNIAEIATSDMTTILNRLLSADPFTGAVANHNTTTLNDVQSGSDDNNSETKGDICSSTEDVWSSENITEVTKRVNEDGRYSTSGSDQALVTEEDDDNLTSDRRVMDPNPNIKVWSPTSDNIAEITTSDMTTILNDLITADSLTGAGINDVQSVVDVDSNVPIDDIRPVTVTLDSEVREDICSNTEDVWSSENITEVTKRVNEDGRYSTSGSDQALVTEEDGDNLTSDPRVMDPNMATSLRAPRFIDPVLLLIVSLFENIRVAIYSLFNELRRRLYY